MKKPYNFNGKTLLALRKAKGYSQAQLAKISGVSSHNLISHWELGVSKPGLGSLYKLAAALECDIFDLLEDVSNPIFIKMLSRGLTQKQLAAAAGVPLYHLCRWCNNIYTPSVKYLVKLAAALDCSIEELI